VSASSGIVIVVVVVVVTFSHECVSHTESFSLLGSMEEFKTEMMGALQKDGMEKAKTEIINAIVKNKVDKKDLLSAIQTNKVDERTLQTLKGDLLSAIEKVQVTVPETVKEIEKEHTPLIPKDMDRLFAGMARVDRDEFFKTYDIGVPKDETTFGNKEVLLLYSDAKALPDDVDGDMPLLSAEDATEHCNTLKVVLTEPNKRKECLAIVGQWESYHVHKWMRLPGDKEKEKTLDERSPLRYVSRLHIDSGLAQRIPTPPKVKEYNEMLVRYLSSLDLVLDELKPIAAKAGGKENTIVVMVCNHGQSELLMNFVCSSRARGFDLSQVLVFATDMETKELAEGLGLTAFYDHTVRDMGCVCVVTVFLYCKQSHSLTSFRCHC